MEILGKKLLIKYYHLLAMCSTWCSGNEIAEGPEFDSVQNTLFSSFLFLFLHV